jgi:hypothetical protein
LRARDGSCQCVRSECASWNWDDANAEFLKRRIAETVMVSLIRAPVHRPVQFDDELHCEAAEIRDESMQRT